MKKLLIAIVFLVSHTVMAEVVYDLKTTLGGKVFNDILVLNFVNPRIFTGTLTSPGLFTFPIENAKTGFRWEGMFYSFDVTIKENNQSYKVTYSLQDPGFDRARLTGDILQENGSVIGSVEGTRRDKETQ